MTRRRSQRAMWVIVLLLASAACTSPPPPVEPDPVPLLTVLDEKDGDSFVASDGIEYRVGMINTPELSECGGTESSDRVYALLADGFTVEGYERDNHGRTVARVATREGDLGVILAREGMADDRYLDTFRHEHPAYAAELDIAFAEASSTSAGFWLTCWAEPAPQPSDEPSAPQSTDEPSAPLAGASTEPGQHAGRVGEWPCHPAYVECIPDGPDLDCREVGHQIVLFGRDDPFRLDGNQTTATDGTGCDTYPAWSPDETYPYYSR